MGSLAYILPWVFASVCAGLVVGFMLGRGRDKHQETLLALQLERQTTLKMLVNLLGTAEQISTKVESHNDEIKENAAQVGSIRVNGELEVARLALLHHMTTLLTSNKQLQDDLLCTRYRLEEQAQEIDTVRREARTDELTRVANRKSFNEKLHLLLREWREKHQPFSLILIDLDKFKWINDAHGHQAGDNALQSVGKWLAQWVREGDHVGRYGGDEFAILLPFTDLAVACDMAETIRKRTTEQAYRVAIRGQQVSIALSIGVATARDGDTDGTILARADESLLKAKRQGRNQVQREEPLAATPLGAPPLVLPAAAGPTLVDSSGASAATL